MLHTAPPFPPLLTPEEMRTWDTATIATGIPESLLMENAARAAIASIARRTGSLAHKRIWLFAGSGNNGGDTICMARHLMDMGARPLLIHTTPCNKYRNAAAKHLRWAQENHIPFIALDKHDWSAPLPHIIIDGLLGTGFTAPLRQETLSCIQRINTLREHCLLCALDIPSGLNAQTGQPSPIAIEAHLTITFEAAKRGLILPEARPFTGDLHIVSIGIPQHIRGKYPPAAHLLNEQAGQVLPQTDMLAHKNTHGHVIIFGGSAGLTGAPHLAAKAALRTGTGLVTIACPQSLCAEAKGGCADIMTIAANTGEQWNATLTPESIACTHRATSLVIGPGMGRTQEAASCLETLLSFPNRPPAVIDADALVLLAMYPSLLSLLKENDVLTPHPGEAAQLLHSTTDQIQAERIEAIHTLSTLAPSVWILKGAGTLLYQVNSWLGISPYALPNLAVAGSGDVLSGCIGALLARKLPAQHAAATGIVLHAFAGKCLEQRFPERGNISSEIAETLPQAMKTLHTAADQFLPYNFFLPHCNAHYHAPELFHAR